MDGVFWAVTLTTFLRLRDVPIRQPGADAHPCDLELSLAVLKIRALSAIAAERWLAVHIAAPRPLIDMSRKTGILPDPANWPDRYFAKPSPDASRSRQTNHISRRLISQ